MKILTPGDLDIVSRTVYAEGRSEPYEGMKAIVHVIINRTDKKVGDADHSLAATALRSRQFSAWLEADTNRRKLERITLNDRTFRRCMRAVLEAIDEPDFTQGSTHYHTHNVRPRWSRRKIPVYQTPGHRFFNNID